MTYLTRFVVSPSANSGQACRFVVSLSNHERPFDMLRASGLDSIFMAMTFKRASSNEGMVSPIYLNEINPR
ncbi:MAG: hypothetical protein KAW13_07280, partial [Dehalococcoidia bacterium]|nr:hypothetical protein [Dehalococcoidia bacterium]